MQLKQRIRKIEEKLGSNKSEPSCDCYEKCLESYWHESLKAKDEGREINEANILAAPDRMKRMCVQCSKPIVISAGEKQFREHARRHFERMGRI